MHGQVDTSNRWRPRQFSLLVLFVLVTLCAVVARLWPPPTRVRQADWDAERLIESTTVKPEELD